MPVPVTVGGKQCLPLVKAELPIAQVVFGHEIPQAQLVDTGVEKLERNDSQGLELFQEGMASLPVAAAAIPAAPAAEAPVDIAAAAAAGVAPVAPVAITSAVNFLGDPAPAVEQKAVETKTREARRAQAILAAKERAQAKAQHDLQMAAALPAAPSAPLAAPSAPPVALAADYSDEAGEMGGQAVAI